MKTLICPYTSTCIIYRNYEKRVGDSRVNIILDQADRGNTVERKYACLALEAHQDRAETGVPTKDIAKRFDTVNEGILDEVGCSHITVLNKLETIPAY